jgi:hypothetical protein
MWPMPGPFQTLSSRLELHGRRGRQTVQGLARARHRRHYRPMDPRPGIARPMLRTPIGPAAAIGDDGVVKRLRVDNLIVCRDGEIAAMLQSGEDKRLRNSSVRQRLYFITRTVGKQLWKWPDSTCQRTEGRRKLMRISGRAHVEKWSAGRISSKVRSHWRSRSLP